MEVKSGQSIRAKSGFCFLKIIFVAAFACLLLHFIFSRRREVVEEINVWIRPYLHYPPEKVAPVKISKGDVLPLQTDKLDEDTRPNRAVVVVATGGVGNQLFMYAAGYAFARCLGLPLFVSPALPGNYDFGIFPEPHPNTLVREFVLHHFNLPSHQLIKYDVLRAYLTGVQDNLPENVNGQPVNVETVTIDELNFHNTVEVYYQSVGDIERDSFKPKPEIRQVFVLKSSFQSQLFFDGFEAELQEIFSLESYINSRMVLSNYYLFDLLKNVKETTSVAIHVRRGDLLLANSEFTPLPWAYYEKAMNILKDPSKADLHFFIFSDSLEMVRNEFENRELTKYGSVTFVKNDEGMTNLKELYLMENCKQFVIPNSAFSWWAAFLNSSSEHAQVIAPYPRFTTEDYATNPRRRRLDDMFPIYPPGWHLVNPWVK